MTGLVVVPGGERYVASTQDLGFGETATITVADNKAFEGNSEELGVMFFKKCRSWCGESRWCY